MIIQCESKILIIGSVGVGKTTAIQTICDEDVISTEVIPTDAIAQIKSLTTVGIDFGVINVANHSRIVLYGMPGQERFEFMLTVLLDQINAVLLLINHSSKDPVGELRATLEKLSKSLPRSMPMVIGITHYCQTSDAGPSPYFDLVESIDFPWNHQYGAPPIFIVDTRKKDDVISALIALAAITEGDMKFKKNTLKKEFV